MKTVNDAMNKIEDIRKKCKTLRDTFDAVRNEVYEPYEHGIEHLMDDSDPWKPPYIPEDAIPEYEDRRDHLQDAIFEIEDLLDEYIDLIGKIKIEE